MILWERKQKGFTIVELLIVVVVIAILATITIVSFNGIQARARDTNRIENVQAIAKAIELYKVDKGQYPAISDAYSAESTCGSQTENWGHCDRWKLLSDEITPYMRLDPTSLSAVTTGNYSYRYTSQSGDNFQSYGMLVFLEGNGGANDGGYFANAFEVGPKPSYCMSKYSGTSANWTSYVNVCTGGN
jgi:prepilin-type N-terminal cleavage/methylation domain-containing protein